jgi:hypothetical protein
MCSNSRKPVSRASFRVAPPPPPPPRRRERKHLGSTNEKKVLMITTPVGPGSHLPPHGSREVIIILGSLTTCDPTNIHDTISQVEQER